ncbi:hypothetical protein MKX01_008750 [Papaver californicum]|nr:hypothetical protein MKX01_008750 [Papaver californicum]
MEKILEIGGVDPAEYPLPKTKLTLELLRGYVHLRPRANTVKGAEREPSTIKYEIEAAKLLVNEKGGAVAELKSAKASKSEITASVFELTKSKENLAKLKERSKLNNGKIDYSSDFFARQAFLTVSGQLHVETYACALRNVYTFGPTFRAEHSHTSRHLAEFWMVEPELAFVDLESDMNYAEAYVKFLSQWLLDNCLDVLQFFVENFDKTAIDHLKLVSSTPFKRTTYTDVVALLEKVTEKKFENAVEWGIDIDSEHERYLTEVIFKKPVIVYNYPKGIKAFYMRLSDNKKTGGHGCFSTQGWRTNRWKPKGRTLQCH